ncbi:MAG: dipeptidase [Myxococcota bacterium]|jgi:microsomal dipeptidase-like Zn-dependent dipeptidase
MSMLRKAALALALLLVAGFCALPRVADHLMNAVERPRDPFAIAPGARALQRELRIADLHADPLLWPRDLLARGGAGQVDVPRLIDGRVVLQVFGVPTQTPYGLNFERNSAETFDMTTPLAMASGWAPRTYTSRLARALHQTEVLREAASASGGKLTLIATRADLAQHLAAFARDPQRTAGFLGLEGMHALEGRVEALDELRAAGFRMIGFAHFFDNPFAGSSAGEEKHGLTPLGREALARMDELELIADLAHASPATIRDVLAQTRRPVVVSHTGVQATCPGPRNLGDDEIRAVAAGGGLIGIGAFDGAVCDTAPRAVARAMRHVRDLVGIEHVALGSDFDGAVTTAFDISETAVLVDALFEEGFTPDEVRRALGENTLALFAKLLPE